jgi:hypothetical protein
MALPEIFIVAPPILSKFYLDFSSHMIYKICGFCQIMMLYRLELSKINITFLLLWKRAFESSGDLNAKIQVNFDVAMVSDKF